MVRVRGSAAARLDEVAARADAAVGKLRGQAGWIQRKLLHTGPELLDLADTPPPVKQRILDDVDRLTKMLQLHRLWTWQVGKQIVEARRTRRGKPVRVLDVGAGAGGLLFRIGDWARRRRIPVELYGLDYEAKAVEAARRAAFEEGRKVDFRVGDARALEEWDAGGMDVVVTTFMLHHLPPGDAARVLAELDRVAAVNYYAFDLSRSLAAIPPLWAMLRFGKFELPTRHDSLVSLRRGYTLAEVQALLAAANVQHAAVRPIAPAFFAVTRV
jgi:SAM-dependent methyltransferase